MSTDNGRLNDPYTCLQQEAAAILEQVTEYDQHLESVYSKLAQCRGSIPDNLRDRVERECMALKRTSATLKQAGTKTSAMADELSARLFDKKKSIERHWYQFNPPANAEIDLMENKLAHFARGMNVYKLILILFIGSFFGVVIELIWCFCKNGYVESRSGLVYGPFNLLYGVGAVALSLALYRFRNRGWVKSFLGGVIIGSVVEYLCSLGMELVFGSRSWDYSHIPFNLNGRICLLYSLFWGVLGVVWIKDLYPRMAKWILKIPNRAGKIITIAAAIFLAINCIVSGFAVQRWSERKQGIPPNTPIRAILDQRFPDERMESIYANMVFDQQR